MAPLMPPAVPETRVGPLYRRAVQNIERLMDETKGIQQKEIALGAAMSETVYSQKKRGIRSHFYEDEFEAIAVFFRKRTDRPLIGFPHLDWDLMLACDRQVGGWRPRGKP
jgi:hypothetical protein